MKLLTVVFLGTASALLPDQASGSPRSPFSGRDGGGGLDDAVPLRTKLEASLRDSIYSLYLSCLGALSSREQDLDAVRDNRGPLPLSLPAHGDHIHRVRWSVRGGQGAWRSPRVMECSCGQPSYSTLRLPGGSALGPRSCRRSNQEHTGRNWPLMSSTGRTKRTCSPRLDRP